MGCRPFRSPCRCGLDEGSNHLGQWYDGAGFFGAADPVVPGTTGIVIRLREGGEVSGVVRDDRGVAVPGAAVSIIGCPALCPMAALTDDSGAYRINGVPPGPGLRAYADADAAGLLSTWYTAPGQAGDTSFDLAAGEVRSDLDFALTAGAVAAGRVLDGQTGEPIPGVSVDLVDVDNPLNSYVSRVMGDTTAASGDADGGEPGRRRLGDPQPGGIRTGTVECRSGVGGRDRSGPPRGVLPDRLPGHRERRLRARGARWRARGSMALA